MKGGGIVRPILGPLPSALCAPGPACGCPNLFQTNLSNPVRSSTPPSPPEMKTAREGPFLFLAERVGFEPTVRYERTPDFESGTIDHSATSPARPRRDYRRPGTAATRRLRSNPSEIDATPPFGSKKNSPLSWPAKRIGAYCGDCGNADVLSASEVDTWRKTRCASISFLLSVNALRKARAKKLWLP